MTRRKPLTNVERRIADDDDFAERFQREIAAARKRSADRRAARNLAAAYHPHRETAQ